jgi:hypothetical protein
LLASTPRSEWRLTVFRRARSAPRTRDMILNQNDGPSILISLGIRRKPHRTPAGR